MRKKKIRGVKTVADVKMPELKNKMFGKYRDIDVDKELDNIRNGRGSEVLGIFPD